MLTHRSLSFLLVPLAAAALAPTLWADLSTVEEAVVATNGEAPTSIDADGDRFVAGTPFEDVGGISNAGAVYVFRFDGTDWVQAQRFESPTPADNHYFGWAVALHGDLLAISEQGLSDRVYIYREVAGQWTLEQSFTSQTSSNTEFGVSLAMDGEHLVVGSHREPFAGSGEGAAFVYKRAGNSFQLEAMLQESHPSGGQFFGRSVDLDAAKGRLIVGAASYGPGAAYIYHRSGSSWNLTATLEVVTFEYLAFGQEVQIQGDIAVVGASSADTVLGVDSGAIYTYRYDGSAWLELGQTLPPETTKLFGSQLALDGGLLSATENDPFDEEIFTFGLQGSTWTLLDTVPDPFIPSGSFSPVAWSEGRLFAGALGPQVNAVYIRSLAIDGPAAYCTPGTSAAGCTAAISAAGQASASSPTGFTLSADGIAGAKRGLFYWGANGRQANPWGTSTSFQCVVPPVARGPLFEETGTQGLCDGLQSLDLNARWAAKPEQNPGVGAVVQAQYWYRDPFNGSSVQTSLSDALEFTVSP